MKTDLVYLACTASRAEILKPTIRLYRLFPCWLSVWCSVSLSLSLSLSLSSISATTNRWPNREKKDRRPSSVRHHHDMSFLIQLPEWPQIEPPHTQHSRSISAVSLHYMHDRPIFGRGKDRWIIYPFFLDRHGLPERGVVCILEGYLWCCKMETNWCITSCVPFVFKGI